MAARKASATLFKGATKKTPAPSVSAKGNQNQNNYTFLERTRPMLFFTIAGICGWAGNWQVSRRKEKMEYLDLVHSRVKAAPVDCPNKLNHWEMKDNKYLKVKIEGTPYFDKEIIVGPRVPPRSAGITKYPGWGGFIYTPLKLKDSDKFVIINRGWIPEEEVDRAPETCSIDLNSGEYVDVVVEKNADTNKNSSSSNSGNSNTNININVNNSNRSSNNMSFIGMLAPLKIIPDFFDDFDVSKQFWPWINKEKMIEKWNDIGFVLDEDEVPVTINIIEPTKDFSQWPQRISKEDLLGVTVSPEQHGSYVAFWYSMSALCFWYTYIFLKNPRATRMFPRRRTKPLLKRSDVLEMPERELKF